MTKKVKTKYRLAAAVGRRGRGPTTCLRNKEELEKKGREFKLASESSLNFPASPLSQSTWVTVWEKRNEMTGWLADGLTDRGGGIKNRGGAVSYTHLTLPTIYSV